MPRLTSRPCGESSTYVCEGFLEKRVALIWNRSRSNSDRDCGTGQQRSHAVILHVHDQDIIRYHISPYRSGCEQHTILGHDTTPSESRAQSREALDTFTLAPTMMLVNANSHLEARQTGSRRLRTRTDRPRSGEDQYHYRISATMTAR